MSGLFAGTPLERPVTCEVCEQPLEQCGCPRDSAGRVLPPHAQTAIIGREKRAKGKVVTAIRGLDPVASDLNSILSRLKSTLGTGGGTSDGVIEVQGDHREQAAATLRSMGYTVKISG